MPPAIRWTTHWGHPGTPAFHLVGFQGVRWVRAGDLAGGRECWVAGCFECSWFQWLLKDDFAVKIALAFKRLDDGNQIFGWNV